MNHSRQAGILDPEFLSWPVHIIGLGGIGSALVLDAAKMGVSTLHLWDDDTVEDVNIPVQRLYRPCDIGKKKTQAVFEILTEQYGIPEDSVIMHTSRVISFTHLDGIVISGVDSMKSRAAIWDAVWKNIAFIPLYLDGRLGKEVFELHVVQPSSLEARECYELSLFPDEEGVEYPCTERGIIYPPSGLAALMLSRLTRFTRNELPNYQRHEFDYESAFFHAWSHEKKKPETSEERR